MATQDIKKILQELYVLMYGHKHQLKNLCILTDGKINSLASKYGYKISWIPREINVIADRVAKLELMSVALTQFYKIANIQFVDTLKKCFSRKNRRQEA